MYNTVLVSRVQQSEPYIFGFPGGSVVKNPPANAGDIWSLGWEDPPEEGNGNPLQYSCLGNPMNSGACWTTVCGFSKESNTT